MGTETLLDLLYIEEMYHFLDPELCDYNCGAIYLMSFNRPLLLKKSQIGNREDSGYNSTSLEYSLLEAEDILIVKCHSTPTKNEKVQNIDRYIYMGLPEIKDIFQGYFDVKKIEYKHFTKNINRFKTAIKNGPKIIQT